VLNTLYPTLLSLLSHPKYGSTVAQGFTTLLQPDDLLTKENHCQILGLHKHKSFALLVPNITSAFKDADQQTKPNYLIALSGALRWMPFDIVVEEVGQLVTLLLQSLDLKGVDIVKEAAIGTLISTLQEKPEVLKEHTGALISRLLANATTTSSSSKDKKDATPPPPPSVRIAALKCLLLVAEKFSEDVVVRYRRGVCKSLVAALDDPKRDVRTVAVKCRAKWLLADEPDDD